MIAPIPARFVPVAQTALRVVAGAAFFSHGAQKIFGWFGGFGPDGGTAELMTRFGAAGIIELVCGFLITIGLLTRLAAFIASGEIAVAYLWMHVGSSGSIWWWENRGELAMLFSFIFLLYAAWGAGPFSVDASRPGQTKGRDNADDGPALSAKRESDQGTPLLNASRSPPTR
jgi:putative oxidoreductase